MRNKILFFFFFSSRRRHTRCSRDWSSDVCSSDLLAHFLGEGVVELQGPARDPIGVVLAAAEGAREIVVRGRDTVVDAQGRQIRREEGALLRDAGLLRRIALLGVVVSVRVVVS